MESDGNVRKRERYTANDWDPLIPYGGKVYLPRKKKPDSWFVFGIEITLISLAVILSYYAYYHIEFLYSHTIRFYAHMGYKEAQHQLGQRYLRGIGVPLHHHDAIHWFKKAAEQGHPHSAYNLAVAKLKGYHDLEKGETRKLLHHASKHGIKEAEDLIEDVCNKGKCND